MAQFEIKYTKTMTKIVKVNATKAEIVEEMGLESVEDKADWKNYASDYFDSAIDIDALADEDKTPWEVDGDVSWEIEPS